MAETPKDLFRSCQTRSLGKGNKKAKTDLFIDRNGAGSLYPNMGFTRKDGSVRPPDITTETDSGGGIWVRGVNDDDTEGVSISTSRGGFGYSGWAYFLLPEGTDIHEGLDVAPTPTRRDPGHYSIRCRNRMRMDAYEGALDTLARIAIAKAVELGKKSLYFSASD